MKKIIKITGLFVFAFLVMWWPIKSYLLDKYGENELNIIFELVLTRFGFISSDEPLKIPERVQSSENAKPSTPQPINVDNTIKPFKEIGHTLGNRAKGNSYLFRGATLLDANGDGLMDLYLTHIGRPIGQSDEKGVLINKKRPAKPSTLYINMGNNAQGEPIYKSIQELIQKGNKTNTHQELLIENKYKPRKSIDEDEFRVGRIAYGAIAADFNGDKRIDLYVLNAHYGAFGQTDELSMKLYANPSNIGREKKSTNTEIKVRTPSFLRGTIEDGKDIMLHYGAQAEAEGRNSLFLNLGDEDKDGIPEWRDVTDTAGVGGRWTSASATVADIDRDGDLDLYVGNFLDPDYHGFGTYWFAGNRNQLYINQLSESGQFSFKEQSLKYGVSGLHDEEDLESSVWFPDQQRFVPIAEHRIDGQQVGEKADHTWAVMFTDFNQDHWPDLVVANDLGNRLRIYKNNQGQGFEYFKQFNDAKWDGCWMGIAEGDLDGDLQQELMLGNCGSQVGAARNNAIFATDAERLSLLALTVRNYFNGIGTLHNSLIQYDPNNKQFSEVAEKVKVEHSKVIPPDITNIDNVIEKYKHFFQQKNAQNNLKSYEFSWNVALFDVENDGDLDAYMAGALFRGNDNFFGDGSGNPGRLLINQSTPGNFQFSDKTLEYQVLDITDMDYTHNPPRRVAPGTNWHKRDMIYVTDTDAYSGSGISASRSNTHDIFRMHEAAHAVIHGDLNNDGFEDMVVTHAAGFNSLSPKAKNLKVNIAGRELAIPGPNKIVKPPTNFEESATFVYINGGTIKGREGNWVKIKLYDPSSSNLYGVGAKVTINQKIMRYNNIGGVFAGGNIGEYLHIGLGGTIPEKITINWPSHETTEQRVELSADDNKALVNDFLCIQRFIGRINCNTLDTN